MNEATADNNGVYLLDGRHSNGCRQHERERERESDRLRVQVCSSAQCGSLHWCSTFSLYMLPFPSACMQRRTVLTPNCAYIWCQAPIQQARCFASSDIYIKTDAAK